MRSPPIPSPMYTALIRTLRWAAMPAGFQEPAIEPFGQDTQHSGVAEVAAPGRAVAHHGARQISEIEGRRTRDGSNRCRGLTRCVAGVDMIVDSSVDAERRRRSAQRLHVNRPAVESEGVALIHERIDDRGIEAPEEVPWAPGLELGLSGFAPRRRIVLPSVQQTKGIEDIAHVGAPKTVSHVRPQPCAVIEIRFLIRCLSPGVVVVWKKFAAFGAAEHAFVPS